MREYSHLGTIERDGLTIDIRLSYDSRTFEEKSAMLTDGCKAAYHAGHWYYNSITVYARVQLPMRSVLLGQATRTGIMSDVSKACLMRIQAELIKEALADARSSLNVLLGLRIN